MTRPPRRIVPPKSFMKNETLIMAVQGFPVLWDKCLPEYRDKTDTTQAWNSIASMFVSGSPHDCKKSWHNLCRARNNNLAEKARQELSGAAAHNHKPYCYGGLMSFLDGQKSPYVGRDGNVEDMGTAEGEGEGEDLEDIPGEGALDWSFRSQVLPEPRPAPVGTRLFASPDARSPLKSIQERISSPFKHASCTPEAEKENCGPFAKKKKPTPRKATPIKGRDPKNVNHESFGEQEQVEEVGVHAAKLKRQRDYDNKRALLKKKLDVKVLEAKLKHSSEIPVPKTDSKPTQNQAACQFGSAVQAKLLEVLSGPPDGPPDDAVTHFCLSLADDLRALPRLQRLGIQIDIMRKVYEASADQADQAPQELDISRDMEVVVAKALRVEENDEVSNRFRILVKGRDIRCLQPKAWLNDVIVDMYLKLIEQRGKKIGYPSVYPYSSFFMTALRNRDFSLPVPEALQPWKYEILLVPVLESGNHWCLIIVDLKAQTSIYYDSLYKESLESAASITLLLKYLRDLFILNDQVFEIDNWAKKYESAPHQSNSNDCGVFACTYAEHITRGAKINFTQLNMPNLRKQMIYEVQTLCLLH